MKHTESTKLATKLAIDILCKRLSHRFEHLDVSVAFECDALVWTYSMTANIPKLVNRIKIWPLAFANTLLSGNFVEAVTEGSCSFVLHVGFHLFPPK